MRSAWMVAISLAHAVHANHTPVICETPEVLDYDAACDIKAVIRVSASLLEGGRNDTSAGGRNETSAGGRNETSADGLDSGDVAAACACFAVLDRLDDNHHIHAAAHCPTREHDEHDEHVENYHPTCHDGFNGTCPNGTMFRSPDDMFECQGHCMVQDCCVEPYFTGHACPEWQVVHNNDDLCREAADGTLLEPCPIFPVCGEFFANQSDNRCFRSTVETTGICVEVCRGFVRHCRNALPLLIEEGILQGNMLYLMESDSSEAEICGC